MNIRKFKSSLASEKDLLRLCKKSLRRLPEGGLSCYHRGSKVYYRKNLNATQIYLGPENHPEVQKLKKRYLLENMIKILENNISLLEQLEKGYQDYNPFLLQRQFREAYQNVDPELLKELGYIANPNTSSFRDDEKIYKTITGLMVRSRAEAMIADLYTQKGLSFEYESPLYFRDGSMIRPDFKIYCGAGDKVMYHEHIGLLSDPGYRKTYLWKLEKYISEGYYPYIDVLFTYEKDNIGINMTEINTLIDTFIY